MIKKGLALQSSSLREDELELEVPPDLVAGRLGGAHAGLERITGRALASRLEWISVGESLCWFWGWAAPSRPGVFAVSGCVPGCAGRCAWPPAASYLAHSRCPLPLLIRAAEPESGVSDGRSRAWDMCGRP